MWGAAQNAVGGTSRNLSSTMIDEKLLFESSKSRSGDPLDFTPDRSGDPNHHTWKVLRDPLPTPEVTARPGRGVFRVKSIDFQPRRKW